MKEITENDLYKIVVDTRNMEISMFWSRSNYFLALNTAIAVGYLSSDASYKPILLSILGFFVSILWFRVNLGSKYWQSRWERRAAILEEHLAPNANLFSASQAAMNLDVIESIERGAKGSWIKNRIYKKVLEKPSVTYQMILLSLFFCIAWVIFLWLSCNDLYQSPKPDCKIITQNQNHNFLYQKIEENSST